MAKFWRKFTLFLRSGSCSKKLDRDGFIRSQKKVLHAGGNKSLSSNKKTDEDKIRQKVFFSQDFYFFSVVVAFSDERHVTKKYLQTQL